ncbi:MAG TPA: regulatory protein RecX [Chryseolinea sp.]
MKKTNQLSSDIKQKIYKYCAYQERTHFEVRNKLYEYGLGSDAVDELITQLIGEGYLNEERFAKTFAGGKFRIKSWGRIKIVHALEAKGLTRNCIALGLKEINETDYMETLQTLLEKKAATVQSDDDFVMRDKIAKYAIQKGFEPELVWRCIKEMDL